jgi:hypothetical protein
MTNFSLRGWLEFDSQGERVVALVLPGCRSNFPAEWFTRPRGSLLFRLQSLSSDQLRVICQQLPGFQAADAKSFGDAALRDRAWSGLEHGHLLVVEAPRGQFRNHVFNLLTTPPAASQRSAAGAGGGAGLASAAAVVAPVKPKAVPLAPVPTTSITIHLIDHEQKGIPSAACRLLVDDDRLIAGAFDQQGVIKQSGLTVGTCRFTLPDLHRSRWSTISGGGSETIVTSSRSDHRIKAGESIAHLAIPLGYTIGDVWNHAGNQALRERRRHPNHLVPGDVVAFPPWKAKELLLATNTVHVFQRHQEPTTFVMVQLFDGDAPRVDQPWSFKLNSGKTLSGTSDSDGVVTLVVPASATGGSLTVGGKSRTVNRKRRRETTSNQPKTSRTWNYSSIMCIPSPNWKVCGNVSPTSDSGGRSPTKGRRSA